VPRFLIFWTEKSYFFHKVGNVIFYGLDSDYAVTLDGDQLKDMKKISAANPTAGKFAYYHVPTFSACLDADDNDDTWVADSMKSWIPFFQDNKFNGIFENHVHMLKRTLPLKDGKKDDDGIVYFGDGNWGVDANTCDDAYAITKTGLTDVYGNENHVWVLKLKTGNNYEIYPVDVNGDRLHTSTTGTL